MDSFKRKTLADKPKPPYVELGTYVIWNKRSNTDPNAEIEHHPAFVNQIWPDGNVSLYVLHFDGQFLARVVDPRELSVIFHPSHFDAAISAFGSVLGRLFSFAIEPELIKKMVVNLAQKVMELENRLNKDVTSSEIERPIEAGVYKEGETYEIPPAPVSVDRKARDRKK